MIMGLTNVGRPLSPTCRYGTTINCDGPRLEDWFEELDQVLDEDDEAYLPLLPSLSKMGTRRVYDIILFDAAEIEKGTGCSIVMSKRLVAKANTFMRNILK
jgi:hypothetical protein